MSKNLENRWVSILRQKAVDYESKARREGNLVSSPDINDICNEIEAFFAGFTK